MAIEKKTVIRSIDISPETGVVSVKLGMFMAEDGVPITDEKIHRMIVEPGGIDIDALVALNNQDITTRDNLKSAPIDQTHIPLVKQLCSLVQTPAVAKRYREVLEAAEAKLERKEPSGVSG